MQSHKLLKRSGKDKESSTRRQGPPLRYGRRQGTGFHLGFVVDDWQSHWLLGLQEGLPMVPGKRQGYRSCTCEFDELSLFSFATGSLSIRIEHLK